MFIEVSSTNLETPMKHTLKTGIFLILLSQSVFGQSVTPVTQDFPKHRRNAIHAEVGGTGVFASISYERLKPLKNGVIFAPSIGIAAPFPENSAKVSSRFYMMPVQFNWLIGKSSSKIELGLSVNPALSSYTTHVPGYEDEGYDLGALPSFRVGYRYMGPKGLVVRAGYTPIIFMNPWAGVSLGYSF